MSHGLMCQFPDFQFLPCPFWTREKKVYPEHISNLVVGLLCVTRGLTTEASREQRGFLVLVVRNQQWEWCVVLKLRLRTDWLKEAARSLVLPRREWEIFFNSLFVCPWSKPEKGTKKKMKELVVTPKDGFQKGLLCQRQRNLTWNSWLLLTVLCFIFKWKGLCSREYMCHLPQVVQVPVIVF